LVSAGIDQAGGPCGRVVRLFANREIRCGWLKEERIMSKGTRVGAAAVIRMAAAVVIAAGGLTGGPGVVVAAQAPVADGAFTIDQAADGWSVYGVQCGQCHGPNLEGMIHAPPLSGVDFLNSWLGQTTDDMFAYLRDEMPPGQAGALSDRAYVGLVAYLLEANGAGEGTRSTSSPCRSDPAHSGSGSSQAGGRSAMANSWSCRVQVRQRCFGRNSAGRGRMSAWLPPARR
jgi:mono/diheme cytochrome c family protein